MKKNSFIFKVVLTIFTIIAFILIYSKQSIVLVNYNKDDEITFLEDFEYTEEQNNIIINSYNGTNSRIIIPETINNLPVKSVKETIYNNENIKTIILPDTLSEFEYKLNSNIDIECVTSKLCSKLLSSGILVTEIDDKQNINFNNSADNYIYNLDNDKLVINGTKNSVISLTIPVAINGKTVSEVDLSNIKAFIINIPSNITTIGTPKSSILTIFYTVNILIIIIIFLIYTAAKDNLLNNILFIISLVSFFFLKPLNYNILYLILIEFILFFILYISIKTKKEKKINDTLFISIALEKINSMNKPNKRILKELSNSNIKSTDQTYYLEKDILESIDSLDLSKKKNVDNIINKIQARNNILNKKGFSLIELLAVIIILAVIAVITVSNVNNTDNSAKSKMQESKYSIISNSAILWGKDHIATIISLNETEDYSCNKKDEGHINCYIKIKYLADQNYLKYDTVNGTSKSITDPKTKESINEKKVNLICEYPQNEAPSIKNIIFTAKID